MLLRPHFKQRLHILNVLVDHNYVNDGLSDPGPKYIKCLRHQLFSAIITEIKNEDTDNEERSRHKKII